MKKILLTAVFMGITSCAFAEFPAEKIKLPPGFKIEVFASGMDNPRSLSVSPKGTVFVGTRTGGGKVYAIPVIKENGTLKAGKIITIASGLTAPNGVAFKDGNLYVAEISRIIRFDKIEENLERPLKPVIISQSFPSDTWHGWKFIRFGPDGKLYVPVGAPCNVCEKEDLRYASIMRMDPDGKNLKVFSRGIRNTVGFDWDPVTGELWFTDNGRDNLGDDYPPDELNHAPQSGMHFGFPYCHGKNIPDPAFGLEGSCTKHIPPAQELGAHVAALGMRFYTGKMFPDEYRNQIFIAEHGSWNRTEKNGYRIMLVKVKDNASVSYEPFATGWWDGEKLWGRPVDIEILDDGSMLVSDDNSGNIYRITHE
ncbi:MAG: sorbosone dehydrogenase family protein [Candidatus Omnitrophica bacterium]|nr:sorbosone dehydrogenase family protein [Candidatus Omnitrophota bacterium]